MTVYGLADRRLRGTLLGDVIDLYLSRAEAQAALDQVIADEPDFRSLLYVVEIELRI